LAQDVPASRLCMQNTSPIRRRLTFHFNPWALGAVALITAAIASPYFLTHGFPVPAFVLNRAFSVVCHQQPERSFFLFGAPIAVCVRCLGIYLGAAIGLLGRASRRIVLRIFIAAAAINALDAAAELAGLHGNWTAARFTLGLVLGMSAALLISSSMLHSARLEPAL